MIVEYHHVPVLKDEVRAALCISPTDCVLDCTLGGAGHARSLAKELGSDGLFIGIDQDESALLAAGRRLADVVQPEVRLLKGNFSDLDALLVEQDICGVNKVLFDLGVSSYQLDEGSRGFSYREEAPLDMRMDPGKQTKNAAEVINTYNTADLTRILSHYGDEKYASRIARAIVKERKKAPLRTTTQLASLVKEVYPAAARRKKHPAKKTFQAIRMEVNQEMKALERGLDAAIRWLLPGGRIAVISYHSKEDRQVARTFKKLSEGCTCPPELAVCTCHNVEILEVKTKRACTPSAAEIEKNPRARSAKMRVAEKL